MFPQSSPACVVNISIMSKKPRGRVTSLIVLKLRWKKKQGIIGIKGDWKTMETVMASVFLEPGFMTVHCNSPTLET